MTRKLTDGQIDRLLEISAEVGKRRSKVMPSSSFVDDLMRDVRSQYSAGRQERVTVFQMSAAAFSASLVAAFSIFLVRPMIDDCLISIMLSGV